MLIDGIDHVQLAMPPGGEDLATWFYEGVLGVPRVPKPPHLAIRGGCWFERGTVRIHLGVQDDFVAATKAHPAFAVSDLAAIEAAIGNHGLPLHRVEDPFGDHAVYVDDPFGNRIELRAGRGTEPVAPYSETVAAVGAEAVGEGLARRLTFIAELDRLRTVERQSLLLDALRRENVAEHSWHASMLALVLAPLLPAAADPVRVSMLLAVHDLVEIDAGDTGIYDHAGKADQDARERAAADRLFGLLPEPTGAELRAAWEEYEHGDTPDAVAARACDRLAPFLLNLGAGGLAWRRWGATAARVREVLAPVGEASPELGRFVAAMLEQAVADGLLPRGESGLILDTDLSDLPLLPGAPS